MDTIESIVEYYDNIKYPLLSDKAYDILVDLIVSLNLIPGKVYSENEVSEITHIGRTPIREAIKRLEFYNIVTVLPRSGIHITEIRTQDSDLEREVRYNIEQIAIRRTALSAYPHERDILHSLMEKYAEASKGSSVLELLRIDLEFHTCVAQFAKNPYVKTALMPFLITESRLFYLHYSEPERHLQEYDEINANHLAMMRSLIDGDADEACRRLRHLTYEHSTIGVMTPKLEVDANAQ